MDLDDLVRAKSEYLKKEDVGDQGVNLTILGFKRVKVEGDEGEEDKVALLWTQGWFKPLLLNITNKDSLKSILGAVTTDDCKGKVINVYNDPSIRFGQKVVGGVRLREATGLAASRAGDTSVPYVPF